MVFVATKDGWMFLSDYEKDLIDNARMRLFDGHDDCMATGNPFDQPGAWDNGEGRIKKFCDEIFCKKEEDMLYHEFKWIFEKINTGQTHIKNPEYQDPDLKDHTTTPHPGHYKHTDRNDHDPWKQWEWFFCQEN